MSPINTILFWLSTAVLGAFVSLQVFHRPGYHPINADIWGNIDGYREVRLDSDIYQVAFYCNDLEIASRYAQFRAAELTIEKHRDYFIVLDSNSQQSLLLQYHMEHIAFTTVRLMNAPCSHPAANNAKAYLAANLSSIRR